jgi:hypothetical protein
MVGFEHLHLNQRRERENFRFSDTDMISNVIGVNRSLDFFSYILMHVFNRNYVIDTVEAPKSISGS